MLDIDFVWPGEENHSSLNIGLLPVSLDQRHLSMDILWLGYIQN